MLPVTSRPDWIQIDYPLIGRTCRERRRLYKELLKQALIREHLSGAPAVGETPAAFPTDQVGTDAQEIQKYLAGDLMDSPRSPPSSFPLVSESKQVMSPLGLHEVVSHLCYFLNHIAVPLVNEQ